MSAPAGADRNASHWCRLTPTGLGAVTVVSVHARERNGEVGGCTLMVPGAHGKRRPWPEPGRLCHAELRAASGVLDEVIVVGRVDGWELHLHGGDGVLEGVARQLERGGVLEARPRLVEALEVWTWRQARARLTSESGPLARLLTAIEAMPADAPLTPQQQTDLRRASALLGLGERLERLAVVRLVGRANAGKSTLFNALLGRSRALVSPRAGTTRDTVTARWRLRDVPVRLEDSAGVDQPGDQVAGADLVVHLSSEGEERRPEWEPSVIAVRGKADRPGPPQGADGCNGLAVSGLTGQGVAALSDAIAEGLQIPPEGPDDAWTPVGTTVRARVLRAGRRLGGRAT